MSQTIIAKGIEKFFVESWQEWDDLDYLMTQYYRCKLNPTFAVDIDHSKEYNVCIDLGSNKITVYDIEQDDVALEAEIESVKTKTISVDN